MSLLIATQNMGFSPVDLFMDADLVVKSVIVGLALSSIWVWTIIISFTIKMLGINRKSEAFEREFWGSSDIAAFYPPKAKTLTAPERVSGWPRRWMPPLQQKPTASPIA
jgi:biopolymer transport protein TolQ